MAVLPAAPAMVAHYSRGALPANSSLPTASTMPATTSASHASLHPVLVATYSEGATITTSVQAAPLASPSNVAATSVAAAVPTPAPFAPTAKQIAVAIWLLGMLVGLAWIALGRFGLARIRHRATPLVSDEWRAILEAERANAGVEQHVTLLESRTVTSPVTWGVLKPVIVLPSAAHAWTLDRKRVVIMHEMAHIARRDSATQLAATLASIVYWVHPLVLLAARRLRAECERACDERVLALGTPATDYAAHLLDVAKYARSFGAASIVSVAMARPSQLEGRLIAVLRSSPNRGRASARSRAAASVFAAAMLIAISAFMPVEREASAAKLRSSPLTRTSELPNGRALAHVTGTVTESAVANGSRTEPADTILPMVAPPVPRAPMPAAPEASAPEAPQAPVATPSRPSTAPVPAAAPAPLSSLELSVFTAPAAPAGFADFAPPARTAPIAPAAAIAAWGAAPFRVHAKPDSTFTKSVSASSGGTLNLDLDTGGDITITGTDDDKVTADVSLGGSSWRSTNVSLDGSGNEVRLESTYEQRSGFSSFDNSFKIRVPKKFNVHVSSAGGSVTISGVEGTFRGSTAGGKIAIDHAKGDAQLSTGGGDIRITESHLDGSVTSGGGKVVLNNVTGSVASDAGRSESYGNGYYYGYGMPDGYRAAGEKLKMPKFKVMTPMKMNMPDMRYVVPDLNMKNMTIDVPNVRFRKMDSLQMKKFMDADGPEFDRAREAMRDAERAMRDNQEGLEEAQSALQSEQEAEVADSVVERTRVMIRQHQGAMDSARIMMRRNREIMERARETIQDGVDDSESSPRIVKRKRVRVEDGKVIVIDKDGGDIQLDDLDGDARVSTGGGAIIVGRARGKVSAKTGGGDIEIGTAEGAAAATTGGGDVSISLVGEAPHPVNVSSGKGNVEIVLPSNANATLDLEVGYTKSYGRHPVIKGDWPLTVTETDDWDASQGTPRKYVRVKQTIGKGGPVIRVRTMNGDIRLKRGN